MKKFIKGLDLCEGFFNSFAKGIIEEHFRPLGKFCVSVFRQNQEYHIFNVHDGGLFPLIISLPAGWDGMRTACGVNAVPACREYYFKGISPPCGRRT